MEIPPTYPKSILQQLLGESSRGYPWITHGLPKVIECPVFLLSGIEWGCYRHPGCSKWVTPSLPRCRPVLKIFGTVCISNCAKDVCLVKELLGLHCYVMFDHDIMIYNKNTMVISLMVFFPYRMSNPLVV